MTLTTDLNLSIRVSMFEYVRLVTGFSSGRAASEGASTPQPPRSTRSQPGSIRIFPRNSFSPNYLDSAGFSLLPVLISL